MILAINKEVTAFCIYQAEDEMACIPRALGNALNFFGIYVLKDNTTTSDIEKKCWLKLDRKSKLKFYLIHVAIVLTIVEAICTMGFLSTSSVFLDLGCFFIPYYLILYRKNSILYCMDQLSKLSCNDFLFHERKRFHLSTKVLLAFLAYTSIYFLYGMVIFTVKLLERPSKINHEVFFNILVCTNWLLYCLLVYVGTSTFIVLFVQNCMLIYERLGHLEEALSHLVKENKFTSYTIRKQRILFCCLQKMASVVDSNFNDIIFLWIVKILIRTCLGAFNVFLRPWDTENITGDGILVFDAVYDVCHLFILCYFGGKIKEEKDKLFESLTYAAGKYAHPNDDIRNEIHFFSTLIGHSNVGFTAANTFLLTRGAGVTLAGSICSYYILIYQLTLQ